MKHFDSAWAVLRCAALLTCAVGCGSVGEPLPPLLNIPAKVADFRAVQLADEVEFRWTWPLLTTEGSTLKDLESFEVRALDLPQDSGAPPLEAFEQLGMPFAVVAGNSLPAAGAGSEVVLRMPLSERFGKRTAFAVRGVSSRGRTAPWSDYVIRQILRPADPPAGVTAESVAAGVELEWTASDRAERYVVERQSEKDTSFQRVASLSETKYLDAAVPAEANLTYRIRSQVGPEGEGVDSNPSQEVRVARTDVFPPEVPGGLRAVPTQNAVELTWSPVRDAALAGYEVLRNGAPAHEGLVESPAFRDTSPQPMNEYRVRAVDARGNRSGLSEPVTANLQ